MSAVEPLTAGSYRRDDVKLMRGSRPPIMDRIYRKMSTGVIHLCLATALAEIGIESPEALLGTWLTGREGLEAFVNGAPPVTDDRPLLEHASWVRRDEILRVLPRLLDLATAVPLPKTDPLRTAAEEEAQELRDFYRASLLAREGRQAEAVAAVREVLMRDPQNPYYRWIALGGR